MTLDVLVVIMAGGQGSRLWPLTEERNKPAVVLGGDYRFIDLPVSNALNSGLEQVLILSQGKDDSFTRHLNTAYPIDPLRGQIMVLNPQDPGGEYKGDADAVRQALPAIERLNPDIVVVVPGDNVTKANYRAMAEYLADHPKDNALIPLVEKPFDRAVDLGVAKVVGGKIEDFDEKNADTPFTTRDGDYVFASMGHYVLTKKHLVDALTNCEGNLWGKHVVPWLLENGGILAYNFTENNAIPGYIIDPESGREVSVDRILNADYWEDAGKLKELLKVNGDMLGANPNFVLDAPYDLEHPPNIASYWPMRTLGRKVLGPHRTAGVVKLIDSAAGRGTYIAEATLERTIVSPRARVEASKLKNVLVFDGAQVVGCDLENVIIDKSARLRDVHLKPGMSLPDGVFHEDSESGLFVIPRKYGTEQFQRERYDRSA